MDKYTCTRCGGELMISEHKNNVCLCDYCKALIVANDCSDLFKWKDYNNIDNILESKRGM